MKKVLTIKQWSGRPNTEPETIETCAIYDADDKREAQNTFREEANKRLCQGDVIVYITHLWNYTFKRPNGEEYSLYMYER